MKALKVTKDIVRGHFQDFFLLDETVHFIQGYFVYSLPCLRQMLQENHKQLSVLRADGDMFESTMDILFNLYEFVPVGGFIIIDDWGVEPCEKAVNQFRNMHNIRSKIVPFRGISMYWRIEETIPVKYSWYDNFMKSRTLDVSKKQC